jgi:hypothetical protein
MHLFELGGDSPLIFRIASRATDWRTLYLRICSVTAPIA